MMSEEETFKGFNLFLKEMTHDLFELRIEAAKLKASSRSKFHKQLQELKQGSMSVKEYFDEMHIAMLRAKVRESLEATMDRFLNGLNSSISKQMELYPYSDIKGMVFIAIELEKLMKKKGSNREKEKMKKDRETYEKEIEEKRKIESERECDIQMIKMIESDFSENKANSCIDDAKVETFVEKSEVKSDWRDISIITCDSVPCIIGELQVVRDLFLKKSHDPFLPIESIEPLSLPCQDSRTNLFEERENDSIQRALKYRRLKGPKAVQGAKQTYRLGTLTWRMTWIIAWVMILMIICVALNVTCRKARMTWIIAWVITWMTYVELCVTRGRPPPKPPWHGGVQRCFNTSNWGPNAYYSGPREFQNMIQPYSSPNGCHKGPNIILDENWKKENLF